MVCRSTHSNIQVYKATDKDLIASFGLQSMASDLVYRKDIVAGGLSDFIGRGESNHSTSSTSTDVSRHSPESPDSNPHLLPRCQLAKISPYLPGDARALTWKFRSIGYDIESISTHVNKLAKFYEFLDGSNKIKNGTVPFPENQADLSCGVSIEFRNVSFSYSGDELALKKVSFKIEQGQLCVIVGENGSGKSTILNLITRIYDVNEGEILLNGLDIRTLKLDDVRKAVAVLFQDYSIFPLNLAENIGFGDPNHAHDMDLVEQAAKLGGAEFILDLPYSFNTFVTRPAHDYIVRGTSKLSIFAGKDVDYSKLRLNDDERDLSGGRKQRVKNVYEVTGFPLE
ncbi:hypothetical protein EST38_g14286 [Candolleomyces aberdarensis]|uniref:ABC transporter domain-containing protein n=1 Tax=Candolleomyces aberdarensis TaxID=2316362 RepID=A0A4Q2CXP0_9AGAR|nr:hypothetical protein EST38_g14286 [Candolleomyces aberdarensis]